MDATALTIASTVSLDNSAITSGHVDPGTNPFLTTISKEIALRWIGASTYQQKLSRLIE